MSGPALREARQALRVLYRMDTLRDQRAQAQSSHPDGSPGAAGETDATVININDASAAELATPLSVQAGPTNGPARSSETGIAEELPPPVLEAIHPSQAGLVGRTRSSPLEEGTHDGEERMDSQAAAFSKAASLAFRKGSRNPQAAPLPPRPPREPTALLARESFKQAVRDVQAGQRYLRRDTPTRGPPKDSDNLWELFHSAAASLSTGAGSAVMRDPDNPHGKAPGVWSPRSDARAIGSLLLSSWLNLLCLAVPLGYIAHGLKWNAMAIFILNTIGLVPLALLLGEVTEDLALRFGDVIGGLLNATFGNVVELILSIAALAKGLFIIVAYSLIGSVLSNLLLVLGCCFLLGGTKYKQQSFNAPLNKASCALLFLAAIAITIPSAGPLLYGADVISPIDVIRISRGTAIMLVLVYLSYLYFQLKTHKTFYAPPVEEGETEQPALSLSGAMFMLGAITVIVALCSEFLTSALDDFSKQSGIHEAFLGLIILPIAGNACEHITAVIVAIKDKMDLSIAVALGSSIQISLFVLPVVVLVGWAIGKDFTLDIDAFLILMLTLAVIHAYFVSSDGNSNWLMGLQLVGTYILIALLVAFV